jgi:uncharacterized protein (TIGR03083 family)
METTEPIFVTDLFPRLDAALIDLLQGLKEEEWSKPTVCPLWNVKDIASHLLDGNIRRLSIGRDRYFGEKPDKVNSYKELVDYLNRLNADWIRATKRLSPRVLIELLEQTGIEFYEFIKTLDPYKPALFSVAWAGEEESSNWFDIAREYTEKWHHQQQIRLAVDRPGTTDRELYFPVLDTFMRALPYTYRDVIADENGLLKFDITGEAGGSWLLLRNENRWKLTKESKGDLVSLVIIDQDIAWRLFTKGIDKEEARNKITIEGNKELGDQIFNMLSVMA